MFAAWHWARAFRLASRKGLRRSCMFEAIRVPTLSTYSMWSVSIWKRASELKGMAVTLRSLITRVALKGERDVWKSSAPSHVIHWHMLHTCDHVSLAALALV